MAALKPQSTLVQTVWASRAEILLILCCAVDAADKALLPATFHALQETLSVTPSQLGVMTFCQSLSFSLALPVWGAATACFSARSLLVTGCVMWGTATALLALSADFHVHCFLRLVNGAGLCGVMPIAQAMLCDLVPEDRRGAAFGRLAACTSVAGMLASYAAVSQTKALAWGELSRGGIAPPMAGWQIVYIEVAAVSIALAVMVHFLMPPETQGKVHGALSFSEIMHTIRAILRIPSFCLLVLQGVTGGVPWNAMSFLMLYWQTCGFTDAQTGRLAIVQGLGAVVGSLFGGRLGDAAARKHPDVGRVIVALASVLLSIPTYAAMLCLVPREASAFWSCAASLFLFSAVACWPPVAANRPICAELVHSPAERGQVVALWVMIEGVAASMFGAPLVGVLSEQFGYKMVKGESAGTSGSDADALAQALVGVGVVSWLGCAAAWVLMLKTFPQDRANARRACHDMAAAD